MVGIGTQRAFVCSEENPGATVFRRVLEPPESATKRLRTQTKKPATVLHHARAAQYYSPAPGSSRWPEPKIAALQHLPPSRGPATVPETAATRRVPRGCQLCACAIHEAQRTPPYPRRSRQKLQSRALLRRIQPVSRRSKSEMDAAPDHSSKAEVVDRQTCHRHPAQLYGTH
jgi:hypothetical protein